ncbi:MAG: hypothetical protein EZS28_009479 [Streblomastix strix]|uniref:Uncharacterized protein n=1 Tax=Streblomastix strix TaxID=222440 RepID=A0A5J4WJ84_9EUKA|nr:MAG: hypothetical protein EZS28_009479 [Streblomastix strix]
MILNNLYPGDGYTNADLMYFALDSLFHTRARFILREILRLSSARMVFFRTFSYGGTSLPAAVQQIFTPVPPRRQIQRPLAETNNPYYISLYDAYAKVHRLEEFPNPLGPVGDPTTKHIRPPPTPTSELQPSRFSEPCFALSILRRCNALDRQIVTNGRIVVIGSSDTGISELERLTFAKSRFYSQLLTQVSPQCLPCLESTIIPPPAFYHQPFVEPYPNGMSAMSVTKQIKLKQLQKYQPDAELEEHFEVLLYGSSADSDGRKPKYQLIKEKYDEIMVPPIIARAAGIPGTQQIVLIPPLRSAIVDLQ